MRRSKSYLAATVVVWLTAAPAAFAQSDVSDAECVGSHSISLMMALDCNYATPEQPACFTEHLRLYTADPDEFARTDVEVLAWMTEYSEGRGYKVGGLFDEVCEPALREIEDQTDIGKTLRPMQ